MPKVVRVENYTGHDLLDLETGIKYPMENKVARTKYTKVPTAETEEGTTIYEFMYDTVAGLPEPADDLVCIVSSPVLNYVLQECGNDGVKYPKCCSPHNSQRDKNGKVYGCFGFRFNG